MSDYDDDLPYPGYTPDGPTQIILDADAYRRAKNAPQANGTQNA